MPQLAGLVYKNRRTTAAQQWGNHSPIVTWLSHYFAVKYISSPSAGQKKFPSG